MSAPAPCERLGDTPRLVWVAIGQHMYHLVRGEVELAFGVAGDLLRRAELEDSPDAQLTGHRLAGMTDLHAGRLQRARGHLDAAANILSRAGESVAQMPGGNIACVLVPQTRAALLILLGHYDQARAQTALGLAEAKRLDWTHMWLLSARAAAWNYVLLDEDVPLQLLDALGELTTERGITHWAAQMMMYRGLALGRAGQAHEGLALVREAVARYDAVNAACHVSIALCLAAGSGLIKGPDGLALMDDVSARFERIGVRFFDAEVRRVRGALLADMGDTTGAEAQFAEAIRIARDQGARHWELRTATSLARLWSEQGKRREAHDLLAPVCASFAGESGTPDLERARTLVRDCRVLVGQLL